MRAPKRWKRNADLVDQAPDVADYFKTALGWKPSRRPFYTSANRECGGCHQIKPGSEFDVPVTLGRPDLNLCRVCGGTD